MIATSNEQRRSPLSGVLSSASDVAGDFVELAELQLQLAKTDTNQFVSRSVPSIGGLLASSTMLLVFLPIGLLGLADILSTQFDLDLGLTRLIIGSVGGLFALTIQFICVTRLKTGLNSFADSQSQLRQNLIWLKEMIRRQ